MVMKRPGLIPIVLQTMPGIMEIGQAFEPIGIFAASTIWERSCTLTSIFHRDKQLICIVKAGAL
jgi:hypothetical protein